MDLVQFEKVDIDGKMQTDIVKKRVWASEVCSA